jgi:hypothetical protein
MTFAFKAVPQIRLSLIEQLKERLAFYTINHKDGIFDIQAVQRITGINDKTEPLIKVNFVSRTGSAEIIIDTRNIEILEISE